MQRKSFERKLKNLNKRVLTMGEKVLQRIDNTIESLENNNIALAKSVYNNDNEIDKMEYKIEQTCMNIFALEQPLAGDLRMVAGCLKIITDLERIADQCSDICEIIEGERINRDINEITEILSMFNSVREMFKSAIDVFKNRNIKDAIKVCQADDEIDNKFSNIILECCKYIMQVPSNVTNYVDLMFVNKYIERIGDHCTNIAEWVMYMEIGEHPDLNE